MIAIVNYGCGNLGSIYNMLRKAGAQVCVSSDPKIIKAADKLILPGVGAYDTGMRNLGMAGLRDALEYSALEKKRPILGICLGMQLLTEGSEEGMLSGLGWLKGRTMRFDFAGHSCVPIPVPHMGWNNLEIIRPAPLLEASGVEARFYFAHSYHVNCKPEDVLATATYGYPFPAAIQQGNIVGVQFHPEKSHRFGLAMLRAFSMDSSTC